MTDFPEPLSFTGDPDHRTSVDRRTGPRSEEPGVNYWGDSGRGSPCHHCGRTVHRIYTLADVGVFCSPGCRSKHTEVA